MIKINRDKLTGHMEDALRRPKVVSAIQMPDDFTVTANGGVILNGLKNQFVILDEQKNLFVCSESDFDEHYAWIYRYDNRTNKPPVEFLTNTDDDNASEVTLNEHTAEHADVPTKGNAA